MAISTTKHSFVIIKIMFFAQICALSLNLTKHVPPPQTVWGDAPHKNLGGQKLGPVKNLGGQKLGPRKKNLGGSKLAPKKT